MGKALEVRHLRKTYPGRPPIHAVRGVSFEVEEGSVVALLGPNGAGKSTIMKCILQLVIPTGGEIVLYRRSKFDRKFLYRHVSAVLEGNRNLFWRLTPRQNMEVFAVYGGLPPSSVRKEIEKWIDVLKLQSLDREVRTLSRGQQQKVAIAVALVRSTPFLILDEPTLGLDVEAKEEIVKIIQYLAKEEKKTILFSTHRMDVVEALADKVVVIQEGRVIVDSPPQKLKRMFDAKTYRMEIRGVSASTLKKVLDTWNPKIDVERDGILRVRITLPHDDDIYAIFQRLAPTGAIVEHLDRDIPDLEEAYLRLIKGSRGGTL